MTKSLKGSAAAVSSDNAALKAELEALRAENESLKANANKPRKLSFKVGEKGGVSVYGINVRFPITLYKDQWERLIAAVPDLQAFITAHASVLAVKTVKPATPEVAPAAAPTVQ